MNKIYLVETKEQAEDLVDRFDIDSAISIALSPYAMAAFDARNIKYSIPEDFYTNEELWQASLDSHKAVEEICLRLDNFASAKSKEIKERWLKLYTNYGYPLCVIFDTLFMRIFQLQAIFKALSPDEVFFYESQIYPSYWRGIGFDKRENLYSRIIKEGSWPAGINFVALREVPDEGLPGEPGRSNLTKRMNILKGHISKRLPLLYEIRKNGLVHAFKKIRLIFKYYTNVAILGSEYEWEECAGDFSRMGIGLKRVDIGYNECGCPIKDSQAEKEIFGEVSDLLRFRGVDISAILLPRLAFIYKTGSGRCIGAFDKAQSYIRKIKPQALLFSVLANPEWKSAAWAFKQNRIPAFSKSHGAAGTFESTKVILDNELMYANYYLANGDEVINSYRNIADEYFRNGLKAVCTGSPKLQRLKTKNGALPKNLEKWLRGKKVDSSKKVGVYVTTNYLQNSLFTFFYPPFSDRALFRTQEAIVEFFKNRSDALLVWKLHPNRFHDRPPNIEAGAENIFALRDEAHFIDLLDVPDFIIIDVPATACLQSFTRKLPVFVVMKHIHYFTKAREMLEKRAVCCDEPKDLLSNIDDFLVSGRYAADVNDETFLKAYGTGFGNFDAAKRTVDEVLIKIGTSRC